MTRDSYSLQRTDALPTTGKGGHHARVIHHDLSRKPGVTFVAIGVFPKPRGALRQRLNPKLREPDSSVVTDALLPTLRLRRPIGSVLVAEVSARSTSSQP